MERILEKLGLNKKEAKIYLLLLNSRGLTPLQVAKSTGETRVNAYAILDSLVEHGMAIKIEVDKKFTYSAENPTKLKTVLKTKQNEVTQAEKELSAIMPNMLANFRISQNRAGVLHLEGVSNFKTVYEDILRTKKDIYIFPTHHKRRIPGLNELVEEYIKKEKKSGIKTFALYHEFTRNITDVKGLLSKGVHVKFWDADPYEAQILLYGDNVVINTFTDTVFTTVITDPIISKTMRVIFDTAWSNAKN